jgi:hypothetical protein
MDKRIKLLSILQGTKDMLEAHAARMKRNADKVASIATAEQEFDKKIAELNRGKS